jgi:uncharacterized protein YqgV (UPF0045/DUF77 family)
MTKKEIDAMKRNIEAQLDEYAAAISAADRWYREWKSRQSTGFKIRKGAA